MRKPDERYIARRKPRGLAPTSRQRESIGVRLGKFKPVKGKSILVCINDHPSDWVIQFVGSLGEVHPRENVFFLDTNKSECVEVRNGRTLPYPYAFLGMTSRFLRKLRAALVLVDKGVVPPNQFLTRARRDKIAVAFVGHSTPLDKIIADSECNSSQRGMEFIARGMIDTEPAEAVGYLSPAIAREQEPHTKLKKRIRFFFWRHFLFPFDRGNLRKLSSLEEINLSLGRPSSILCLGNGPSSEDPSLRTMAPDSIFRVNHRWLERGIFTSPDAIFTGAVESVVKIGKDALYIFISDERAMRMVMRAKKLVPRLSFTNIEDLGFPLVDFKPYQPTNGLIMLYLAVKLSPDTLTVAGIDLYKDPHGCYPDESTTPNHYTSAHDKNKELALILGLLASYQGELIIVGEGLASKYEEYLCENSVTP